MTYNNLNQTIAPPAAVDPVAVNKTTSKDIQALCDETVIGNVFRYRQFDGIDLDSPELTIQRWNVIRNKPFLKNIYDNWYGCIASAILPGPQPVLEIGSGAGFMKQYVPELIRSDIMPLPHLDFVIDACKGLPFENESLRGIVATSVLHHLPDAAAFLSECQRVLVPGGVISMVEPWVSPWSSLIYRKLHYEPFIPEAAEWTFDSSGPLSGANLALPWMIFDRDREEFELRFPDLRVSKIRRMMPFLYILSGGVSMRNLVPNCSYSLFQGMEQALEPLMKHLAMFAHIVVAKQD